MGIQEVSTYGGPVDAGSGRRGPGASRERRHGVCDGDTDQFIVSGRANTMYEAEWTGKFEVVRERVRLGYYFKKDVLDQVVDALAKEVRGRSVVQETL